MYNIFFLSVEYTPMCSAPILHLYFHTRSIYSVLNYCCWYTLFIHPSPWPGYKCPESRNCFIQLPVNSSAFLITGTRYLLQWKEKILRGLVDVKDIKRGFLDFSHLEASPFSLRNVSSERSEARRKLRECDGLVDALIFIVQAEIGQKDSDSKVG